MEFVGLQSLITVISHLGFIMLSYWALQSLNTERCFRKGRTNHLQILYILMSIALGYTVSSFVIDFFTHSSNLKFLIQ